MMGWLRWLWMRIGCAMFGHGPLKELKDMDDMDCLWSGDECLTCGHISSIYVKKPPGV